MMDTYQPSGQQRVFMDKDEDLDLVERSRRGDRAAFGHLVARYQRQVYNASYRVLGNAEDARDITQTVFLKVYERLDNYDSQYRFISWIYRIAVNESLNLVRAHKREQPLGEMDKGDDNASPEADAEAENTARRVQAAMMRMSPEERVVLTLRHFLECSYSDIAGILGVPEKTVKSRLYEARQRLRKLLDS